MFEGVKKSSSDTEIKDSQQKVKKKSELSDTGQDGYHSDSMVAASHSDDNSAQTKHNKLSSSTQSVIPTSDDTTAKVRTVLGDNVRDKRLKFINWASSSTSSESDDSISVYVSNRERMLPSVSPVNNVVKDSKYPWRKPRSENRDKSLHVRSVSEPARHTLPDDQIGSSHLPKKSVSVANLAQNEIGKSKSSKTRTLESVKEEISPQDDSAKHLLDFSLVKKGKNVFESKQSKSDSSASLSPLPKQGSNSNSLQAQQTTSSAMCQNLNQASSQSSAVNVSDINCSNDVPSQDSGVTGVTVTGQPSREERDSSNSQYVAPTQEDIYFAAADPDLVGISMPTVKSMVANLNNRLELIASEHPKIAQPVTQTELGLTFTSKDTFKSKQGEGEVKTNRDNNISIENSSTNSALNTKDEVMGKVKKLPSLENLSLDTSLNNNNNSNINESSDGLIPNERSSETSPRTPTGDRKVRFADPPESKVIEIEASTERRRRRGVGTPIERRREDKYPEFYQKKVDDDHQLSLNDKQLLLLGEDKTMTQTSTDTMAISDAKATRSVKDNKTIHGIKPDHSEQPTKITESFKQEPVSLESIRIPSVAIEGFKERSDALKSDPTTFSMSPKQPQDVKDTGPPRSFQESKVKIPDIAFTTCSVKELADRLDKIERENELSNLKLRSMRITREEGDKPLVAMDITGRTYSITPSPVITREKLTTPQTQAVSENIPTKITAKPKYSITMETKPSPVFVTTASSSISSYQLTSPLKSKSISVTASTASSPTVTKPPPPYYTTIPVSHIQQQQQQQLSSPPHQRGNISPSYQQREQRISPIPNINTPPTVAPPAPQPHVQYKVSSPRRSPVQQEELDYYKQRLLPQEAPPPYSALHSYEYYKKLPGAARRNSTGGIMLQTQHLGSGRGFTFSIDSGHGGSGQINVVFSQQQEGADQPTQVAFQIPRGSPMSTYSLSPRDGSPGLSINYQAPPPPPPSIQQRDQLPPRHHTLSPPQLTAYHKPGQSFDESKIIHISYPPNTSPQRSLSSSPRPHSTPDYYSVRPDHSPPQQRVPLFVRTDSPLMRASNNNSGGRRSPYLSPPTPQTHPHPSQPHQQQLPLIRPHPNRNQQPQIQPHPQVLPHSNPQQQQPHSVTYISPGASPMLYEDTSNLSQSRSFKNLENKFTQGGNHVEHNPPLPPTLTTTTVSHPTSTTVKSKQDSWASHPSRSFSSGVFVTVNKSEG